MILPLARATNSMESLAATAVMMSGVLLVLVEHKPVQARAAVLRQRVDMPPDLAVIPFLLQTMLVRRGSGQQLGGQRTEEASHRASEFECRRG